ncbi:MAG: Hsp70 family protein [Alphaproteobacteria bacterium]|nr:Hsp70 family protein [Alphaproteobacteria bacterium]
MAIAGIDLGTTNSLIAVWTADGPRLLENAIGETLTPSAISIAEDGMALVGSAALERLITHPERSAAAFKRWMGTSTGARLAGRDYRAEELSALVLRALREDAEAALGEKIDEAVISVPAYFADPQRKATLDAAKLAGLNVQRLINEPTAAALAHGLETVVDGHFLILDLGGGTFDVSLLHKLEGMMEVRASAGDSLLGGNDFRDALVNILLQRHALEVSALSRAELAQILRETDGLKHRLSEKPEAAYEFVLASQTYTGSVSRDSFEEAAAQLVKRLRAPIERAVNDARVDPAKINQIVLVGGATRMPLLRALVTKLFGRFPMIHPRPDHVIALGAAVQAGLKRRDAALEDIVMTDVCPFTLGTSVLDGANRGEEILSPIIERNSIVPISRMQTYSTAHDGQTAIRIDILQGENLRPSQNITLGEIRIDVPPAPARQEHVNVRYTYDINGALEVEVTVPSTRKVERRVFRNQSNLSEQELEQRFATLAAIKLPPREQAENRVLIARAERLYAESLGEARDQLVSMLQRFEAALNDPSTRDAGQLRRDFAAALARFERSPF